MRILVTGASGFIGSAIATAALNAGHEVHGTLRETSPVDLVDIRLQQHIADLARTDTIHMAVRDARPECVIHCAAIAPLGRPDRMQSYKINVTGTSELVRAARNVEGCRRFIYLSSMSAQPDNNAVYGSTKRKGEEPVKHSNLHWTIFRPSLVYGRDERSVFGKMVRVLKKLPVIPVIGSGAEPVRPVHVDDLADAVLAVLDAPVTVEKTYDIGGADLLSVNQLMRETAAALGRQPRLVHVPLWLARMLASVMQPLLREPPITHDNIEGVEKAAPCEISAAQRDFGYNPRPYAEGVRECLADLPR